MVVCHVATSLYASHALVFVSAVIIFFVPTLSFPGKAARSQTLPAIYEFLAKAESMRARETALSAERGDRTLGEESAKCDGANGLAPTAI